MCPIHFMTMSNLLLLFCFSVWAAEAFLHATLARPRTFLRDAGGPIISPFDDSRGEGSTTTTATTTATTVLADGPLDLTYDNVELVLEEMRPYLIQDGGNVAITDIDGPVVRLELQVCATTLRSVLPFAISVSV